MISLKNAPLLVASEPMNFLVKRLCDQFEALWWSTGTNPPDLGELNSAGQQRTYEKQLSRLQDGLEYGLKKAPASPEGKAALRQQIMDESFNFLKSSFGFEDRQLDVIRRHGFIELAEQFASQARRFDPTISSEDIFQASRNVSSMNLMQLLLGLPVELTPSVFAYSMLYPYTDNYLDNPQISMETKMGFNQRFWNRLAGIPTSPDTGQEKQIWDLVEMVEGQFERARFPMLYASLLAIHEAQSRSLGLLHSNAVPYEVDVLRISLEKGGTSVLADGYLIAGSLSEAQARFMFGYGAFTQLMDDLEDVEADRKDGFMTIFSQTAGRYPLDALTNRLFHLGSSLFQLVDLFPGADVQPLQEMFLKAIPPLLYFSAAALAPYYSREYLQALEKKMPFRVSYLRSQRKKFERTRVSLFHFVG